MPPLSVVAPQYTTAAGGSKTRSGTGSSRQTGKRKEIKVMKSPDFAVENCLHLVRRDDHDRYLTVLHARAEDRPALLALYAFNIEIAKTRELVSEAALGEIRLQWWRETIDGIFDGNPRQHGVALALSALVGRGPVRKQSFLDLIDTRSDDLYDEQPETLDDLEKYAERTAGVLHDRIRW